MLFTKIAQVCVDPPFITWIKALTHNHKQSPMNPQYKQDDRYKIKPTVLAPKSQPLEQKQIKCSEFILANAQQNPESVLEHFDTFSFKNFLMNIGKNKGQVLRDVIQAHKPKVLVELGGYCGYSGTLIAGSVKGEGQLYTVQISWEFAAIAKKVTTHAGLEVNYIIGEVSTNEEKLKALKKIDFLFIDHDKKKYGSDLQLLEDWGLIQKGTVVIADNILYPGAPQYLQHLKNSKEYESILYTVYMDSSEIIDGVLVSTKL